MPAQPRSPFSSLQRAVILVSALLWIGFGVFLAYALSSEFPAFLTRTLAAVVAAGAVVVVAHVAILRLFPSRSACIGLIAGKACALPFTGGFGLFSLAILAMSTDGGGQQGAEIAYATIPTGMALTAVPALIGAVAGAAIGQRIHRRKTS